MTDAEKIAEYDRLVELLKDRIALEKHYCERKASFRTIQDVRIDAYRAVVHLIIGVGALPDI